MNCRAEGGILRAQKRRNERLKKLIAIDGNNILYRAYFALPSMMTKSGVPTGAIYGFLSTLFKLVQEKPDYLLVAFDMHGADIPP